MNIAEEFVIQRGDFDGAAFVGLGVRRLETFGDAVEFGLRLGVGDSGFEARERGEAAAAAFGEILRGAGSS